MTTDDLEAEINRIRDRYTGHNVNIEWNATGGYWAVAVAKDIDIVAFGGSRESLREAVLAVKPVPPKQPMSGPTNG